jgi:hypothetical protein
MALYTLDDSKLRIEFVPADGHTVHGAQVAVVALCKRLGLWKLLRAEPACDPRTDQTRGFAPEVMAAQLIVTLCCGGVSLTDAERLQADRGLKRALGVKRFADQTQLGEWLRGLGSSRARRRRPARQRPDRSVTRRALRRLAPPAGGLHPAARLRRAPLARGRRTVRAPCLLRLRGRRPCAPRRLGPPRSQRRTRADVFATAGGLGPHPPGLALVANQAFSALAALGYNVLTALKLSELPAQHHSLAGAHAHPPPADPAGETLAPRARGGAASLCASRPPRVVALLARAARARLNRAARAHRRLAPPPGGAASLAAPAAFSTRRRSAGAPLPPPSAVRPTSPASHLSPNAPPQVAVPTCIVRIEVRHWSPLSLIHR